MRTFSQGRLARSIAFLLTGVFLWSFSLAAIPASAQVVTKGAGSQTSVAVVPFQNMSRMMPDTLGDEAAAAVTGELRDRLLLDVLPKADVTLQMRDLGMTAPLTDSEIVRLATELDVPLVVTGVVRGARIITERNGKYAEVQLLTRLFDRMARADVNGAFVSAVSPTMADASDEVLIQKALQQAAFSAVEQMKSRPTVTAMVLWSREDTVYLNRGSKGGIKPGMVMVATRGGERIGVVKVTEADNIGSYASSKEGSPLRSGDMVRAIWEAPSKVGADERQPVIAAKRNQFEKIAIAAAVLLGLGSYASGGRKLDEGETVVPNFKARNLSNGVETGYSYWEWGSTLLTWDKYTGPSSRQVVGYEIWRNGYKLVNFVPVVVDPTTYDIDGGQPMFDLGYHILVPDIHVLESWSIDGDTGIIYLDSQEIDVFDPGDDPAEWPTEWSDWVDGLGPDSMVTACQACDTVEYAWYPEPPTAGVSYYYQVKPLIATRQDNGDGTFTWLFTRSTETSGYSQQLTSIAPPVAEAWRYIYLGMEWVVDHYEEIWTVTPNPIVIGNLATFYFYAPTGATDVILQVARDPNSMFDPAGLYTKIVPVSASYEQSVIVNLGEVSGSSPTFWWRFGASNRTDVNDPEPWPQTNLNDFGWVWSSRNAFSLTTSVRASMMHEQRAAMEAVRSVRARTPRTAGVTDRIHNAQ